MAFLKGFPVIKRRYIFFPKSAQVLIWCSDVYEEYYAGLDYPGNRMGTRYDNIKNDSLACRFQ